MAVPEESLHGIAEAGADMLEVLSPMEEAARGYKASLEAKGWSSHQAERIAAEFLISCWCNFRQNG